MQCAQKSANPDKESVNRSEVGQSRQEVGKVRLLVGISVIMAEVGSASESSLLGHHKNLQSFNPNTYVRGGVNDDVS